MNSDGIEPYHNPERPLFQERIFQCPITYPNTLGCQEGITVHQEKAEHLCLFTRLSKSVAYELNIGLIYPNVNALQLFS